MNRCDQRKCALTWENVPQRFSPIPTVSRQIAHEARTVPVLAMPVSRVVNSCEAPAAGHAESERRSADLLVLTMGVLSPRPGDLCQWTAIRRVRPRYSMAIATRNRSSAVT